MTLQNLLRKFSLSSVALVVVGGMAATGCSGPRQSQTVQTTTVGDLKVEMSVTPTATRTGPPHSGEDTLLLDVTDAATGTPVSDANISATATMDLTTTPGALVSGRSQGNGRYEVPIALGVATKYDIKVNIERAGKPSVNFDYQIEAWQ